MTIGSLFAGIGGIDLGFKQAGFDILWANEIDRDACKTYKLNFPDTKMFECDIRKLDVSLLSKVDIITAGFPYAETKKDLVITVATYSLK